MQLDQILSRLPKNVLYQKALLSNTISKSLDQFFQARGGGILLDWQSSNFALLSHSLESISIRITSHNSTFIVFCKTILTELEGFILNQLLEAKMCDISTKISIVTKNK